MQGLNPQLQILQPQPGWGKVTKHDALWKWGGGYLPRRASRLESEGNARIFQCIRAPLEQPLCEEEERRSFIHLKMAGAKLAKSREGGRERERE